MIDIRNISAIQAWCLTKRGGRAMVGVPTSPRDEVVFNMGRLYGDIQLSHLFANWKQVHSTDKYRMGVEGPEEEPFVYQPLYILEK